MGVRPKALKTDSFLLCHLPFLAGILSSQPPGLGSYSMRMTASYSHEGLVAAAIEPYAADSDIFLIEKIISMFLVTINVNTVLTKLCLYILEISIQVGTHGKMLQMVKYIFKMCFLKRDTADFVSYINNTQCQSVL